MPDHSTVVTTCLNSIAPPIADASTAAERNQIVIQSDVYAIQAAPRTDHLKSHQIDTCIHTCRKRYQDSMFACNASEISSEIVGTALRDLED